MSIASGFGENQVPEMPAYVFGYARRGNAQPSDVTPNYVASRFGNRAARGGLPAYVLHGEDPDYWEALPQKRGNHGVYPAERWAPGHRPGIDGLAETRNLIVKGGGRSGAPRRADVVERRGGWHQLSRPQFDRTPFNLDDLGGVQMPRRRARDIETRSDPFVLKEMLDHNPFVVQSWSAKQARELWSLQ